METKKVLVGGATGSAGFAIAQEYLKRGYDIYAMVRDIKKAEEMFKVDGKRDLRVYLYDGFDLEDSNSVNVFISNMSDVDVYFDAVDLAAGSFEWDNDRRIENPKTAEQVANYLMNANFKTKVSVIESLKKLPKNINKKTKVGLIGSHAANFAEDDPRRLNLKTGYKEEGYIASMQAVAKLAKDLQKEGIFAGVYLFEPGLINSPLAHKQFNEITIGENPPWDELPTPEDFAYEVVTAMESGAV
ncbi:MAG TPA: NAD-dependent epimerase/dehydratase family protein [Candidatus Paceibacterota bacterium]|nr:NAD-dependent epimerase/dehydratase family protein [Candidatus Paceibacterota bacterium]